MLIAIICLDKPGALEIRKANRDAHLAHIEGAEGAIVQAGPFLDAEGEMCGSLLIYEGDLAGAEAWAAADPYAAAGLFRSVDIRPWKKVVG
ncbi:MAG: YciI family protein [Proteobacteria bacterium]|nr:YciI family protein [Pseudomonadota bacterium]